MQPLCGVGARVSIYAYIEKGIDVYKCIGYQHIDD
jgi:queuine/archaeosine tRNA-ribosyltransferase